MYRFNDDFRRPLIPTHRYVLAATGMPFKTYEFCSRDAATKYMHKLMDKNGLYMVDKYDDKHIKTYVCNRGVEFYISRYQSTI